MKAAERYNKINYCFNVIWFKICREKSEKVYYKTDKGEIDGQ